MKIVGKILLWILMVVGLVAIIVFGTIGYEYYNTDVSKAPDAAVTLDGSALTTNGYKWAKPVLMGFTYKAGESAHTLSKDKLPETQNAHPELLLPDGYAASIKVTSAADVIFEGDEIGYSAFTLPQNGEYGYAVVLKKEKEARGEYGEIYFDAIISLAAKPEITLSTNKIEQGGVVAVTVKNIMNNAKPEIKTELGMATFADEKGQKVAFVPIAYNREPGEYTIEVRCGDLYENMPITVSAKEFSTQELTIDEGVADATANSPAANKEFRDNIYPLYETADEDLYWYGVFVQPVFGEITTEYGLKRYINGATKPERHAGMDIAASEGTLVPSPNAGKVVFAKFLKLTGNTIVIEHGAGLKSYFYHLSAIDVEVGQMVQTGDFLGKVGSTGFSTGPHLHYEARIGNQSINPMDLFTGTSGLYKTSS